MPDWLFFLLCGIGMGILTAIPPAGPIALMVISRAIKGAYTRGFATAVGGKTGELVWAAAAVAGIQTLFTRFPSVRMGFRIAAAVVLVAVGVYFLRQTPDPEEVEQEDKDYEATSVLKHMGKGFSIGIVNLSVLFNWIVGMGIFLSWTDRSASLLENVGLVVGIGLGNYAWFGFVLYLVHWMDDEARKKFLTWIQRIAAAAVLGAAGYIVYKVLRQHVF